MEDKIKKRLKWINLSQKVKVVVPERVLQQIRYLCLEIDTVEWSGVLFYSVEGEFEEPENFIVTLEYVFPMDKGTGGSTHYELDDEKFIDFRMSRPDSMTWNIGHIHSHNNMSAYFSGTDDEEIEENSEFHNYYLSVVVNNKGNIVGKIGFRGKQTSAAPYQCKGNNGKSWVLNLTTNDDVILARECEIITNSFTELDDNFKGYVQHIVKKDEERKKKEEAERLKKSKNNFHNNYVDDFDYPGPSKQLPIWNRDFSNDIQDVKAEEVDYDTLMEEWSCFFLSFGDIGSQDLDFDVVLSNIDATVENLDDYIINLLQNINSLFLRFFDADTDITITEALEYVVQMIYDSPEFQCSDKLVEALELTINELEEDEQPAQ